MRVAIIFFLLSVIAQAQTGQCHSTNNNGAACTLDSQCTGGTAPYCAVLKHVIFIIKENRSFDTYFGTYPGVTGGPVGGGGTLPCIGTTAGCSGGVLASFKGDPTQPDFDCGHAHASFNTAYNAGGMNKFNATCAGDTHWAEYYDRSTLGLYWTYADNYGLSDHTFATNTGPSTPAHLYFLASQSNEGTDNTIVGCSTSGTTTGTCLKASAHVGDPSSCVKDSDCTTSDPADRCSNGNLYTGISIQGIDVLGGTGAIFHGGVCTAHQTVSCTDLAGDTSCSSLGDTCDTSKGLSGARNGPCPNITTIADILDSASVSWTNYVAAPSSQWNMFNFLQHFRYSTEYTTKGSVATSSFPTAAAGCTSDASCTSLPAVAWVQPPGNASEHGALGSVNDGIAWTASMVNPIMTNTYTWQHSVIFLVWDDWGGFYDHIAPSVAANDMTNGFRVPMLCIGAYCKHAINTTVYTFDAALSCIEHNFSVSNLGLGDATAPNLCANGGATSMVDLSIANPPLGQITAGSSQMNQNTVIAPNTLSQ